MIVGALAITGALLVVGQGQNSFPPSMVKLDFEQKTVAEVIRAIDAAGPNRIAIDFTTAGRLGPRGPRGPERPEDTRLFRFHEDKPITFWSALDQICRAGQLMPELQTMPARRIALRPASHDRPFVSIDGSFRASISSVSYSRGIEFSPYFTVPPDRPNAPTSAAGSGERFAVNVIVLPEPRLNPQGFVALTVLEAVDDRGHSLVSADSARQGPENSPAHGQRGREIFMPVLLRYPDQSGKRIKRLKLVATLDVAPPGTPVSSTTEVHFEFTDVPMP